MGFIFYRYPQNASGILRLVLYTPCGFVLALLRIILGLHVIILAYLLPDIPVVQKFLCKLLCATFGITLNVDNIDKKEDVEVYMSNYVSPLDYLAVHSAIGCITVSIH